MTIGAVGTLTLAPLQVCLGLHILVYLSRWHGHAMDIFWYAVALIPVLWAARLFNPDHQELRGHAARPGSDASAELVFVPNEQALYWLLVAMIAAYTGLNNIEGLVCSVRNQYCNACIHDLAVS